MGLPVESIEIELRDEGLGYGLPMCFIELGYTDEKMEVEEVLREVLEKTGKKGWVCIRGRPDPLACGVGTLVRGLSQLQRYIEVETDGLRRDPSWSRSVDRWVVSFQSGSSFNYGSLRASDSIKILVDTLTTSEISKLLEASSKINCVKYLKVPTGTREDWMDLATQFERVRVC